MHRIARESNECKFVFVHAMKACWEVGLELHSFLTSVLHGDEFSPSYPGRFTTGERAPETTWIGGWVDPAGGRTR
jgi:hypothetical protein